MLGYTNHELPISPNYNYYLFYKNTTGIKTLGFWTQQKYKNAPEYPVSFLIIHVRFSKFPDASFNPACFKQSLH